MVTKEIKKKSQEEEIKAMERAILEKMNISSPETKQVKTESGTSRQEVLDKIMKSELGDIKGLSDTYRKGLTGIIQALNEEAESIGDILSGLTKADDVEENIIKDADTRLSNAEAALKDAEAIPNSWWNRTFAGRESRISRARLELNLAKDGIEIAAKEAKTHLDQRIMNADMAESQRTYLLQCEALTRVLETVVTQNKAESKLLKQQHEIAQKLFIEKAKEMKLVKISVDNTEQQLNNAIAERSDFTPGTEEAAAHEEVINNFQTNFNAFKTEYDEIVATHNSAERFTAQTVGQLTVLDQTAGMIQALKSGLQSDTNFRKVTYPAALKIIQSAQVEKVASGASKSGIKTDKIILEIAASTLNAFYKDAGDRLLKHPEDMKEVIHVLEIMAKVSEEHKKVIEMYHSILKEGYTEDSAPKKSKADPGQNGQL